MAARSVTVNRMSVDDFEKMQESINKVISNPELYGMNRVHCVEYDVLKATRNVLWGIFTDDDIYNFGIER